MKKWLAAFAALVLVVGVPAGEAFAQSGSEQSSSTRVNGRSTRGIIKLVVLGGVVVVGAAGWAIKKMRGE